jgi:uncharacterized protein
LIRPELVAAIRAQYRLPPAGIHGVAHWARVLENGRRLAGANGARLPVVEMFAVFHDSGRRNEGSDAGHGRRGAELARSLRADLPDLGDEDFELLVEACERHTDGLRVAELTVGTCWDADRLDLARVGKQTDPRRLCTEAARDPELLAWASRRAAARVVPRAILEEWALDLTGFP